MAVILEIIVTLLKLLYLVISGVMKRTTEEQKRFDERVKTLSDALRRAVENKDEILDEEAYLSNLDWEKKQRFLMYKTKSSEILMAGAGITELSLVPDMAMGQLVTKKKDLVLAILVKDFSVEEKSKQLAKTLSEA